MNLDQELLTATLAGLEMKKARLEEQIASLRSMTTCKISTKRAKAKKAAAARPLLRRKRGRSVANSGRKRSRSGGPLPAGNSFRPAGITVDADDHIDRRGRQRGM